MSTCKWVFADSWIGSDVSIPVTFRITEMSKSDKEGKTHRGKPLPLDNEETHSAGDSGFAAIMRGFAHAFLALVSVASVVYIDKPPHGLCQSTASESHFACCFLLCSNCAVEIAAFQAAYYAQICMRGKLLSICRSAARALCR